VEKEKHEAMDSFLSGFRDSSVRIFYYGRNYFLKKSMEFRDDPDMR
jgi:hypothetical protein